MSVSTTKTRGPPPVPEISNASRYSIGTIGRPSGPKGVVTSPPWARDEPESPLLDNSSTGPEPSPHPSGASITHIPSSSSEHPSASPETLGDHRRWSFALPRPLPKLKRQRSSSSSLSQDEDEGTTLEKSSQGSSRHSRPRWPNRLKRTSPGLSPIGQEEPASSSLSQTSRSDRLRLEIPLPAPKAPFTLSFNNTPGWNSPWSPRIRDQTFIDRMDSGQISDSVLHESVNDNETAVGKETAEVELDNLNRWHKRRRNFRSFLLHNNHVPLVSRLANITFTTVALGLAIQIRIIEQERHLRGAVGSSPVLAVIFAPLTLVHVMFAIYLEYFGRPLGLWRTSDKLAHTLSEVVFICAWSAELALCFDNYFTSYLNCAPRSTVRWYSELPPVAKPLGDNATSELKADANRICDYQLDLISVVVVALLLNVTNLVISLFRIFEKVKVRQGFGYGRRQ